LIGRGGLTGYRFRCTKEAKHTILSVGDSGSSMFLIRGSAGLKLAVTLFAAVEKSRSIIAAMESRWRQDLYCF